MSNAFLTAVRAESENDRWRVQGFDDDGQELILIVSLDPRVEIITLF